MPSGWGYFVNVLLPIPLVGIVALQVRRPVIIRKAVLRASATIMSMPFIGQAISLLHFFTLLAMIAFLNTSFDLYRFTAGYALAVKNASISGGATRDQLVAKRWRIERNWWLCSFTLVAWGSFWACYKLVALVDRLEERLAVLEKKDIGTVDKEAAARVADPARE